MPYFLGHSGAWVLVGSWMGAWWLDLTWFDHTIWKIIPGVFRTQYIPLALYRLINSWSTIIQDQMKNHPLKKHLRNIGSQILPTTYFSPARSITSRPPREKFQHTVCPQMSHVFGGKPPVFSWWFTWVIGDTVGYIHLEDHPSFAGCHGLKKGPPSDPWPLGVGKGAGKGILNGNWWHGQVRVVHLLTPKWRVSLHVLGSKFPLLPYNRGWSSGRYSTVVFYSHI